MIHSTLQATQTIARSLFELSTFDCEPLRPFSSFFTRHSSLATCLVAWLPLPTRGAIIPLYAGRELRGTHRESRVTFSQSEGTYGIA